MKGKRAPSFGIGKGPKLAPDFTTRRIVPGPGNYDYDIKNKTFSGVSFAKALRAKDSSY